MPLAPTTIPAETANPPLPRDTLPSVAAGKSVTEDLQMKQHNGPPPPEVSAQKYLIRIPQKTDRVKAITAFRRVPATRVTLPGNVMGVNEEHIRELERENIPFQFVSQAPNGKPASL